jgi:Helicase associated domain
METLPPIDDTASMLLHPPTSPLNAAALGGAAGPIHAAPDNHILHHASSTKEERGLSFGSSKTEGRGLDHLDHLGLEAAQNAAKIRKESISERTSDSHDDSSSHGTLNSQSQRFLLEAFLGDGTESLVLNPSQRERLGSFDALGRERLGSFDAAAAAAMLGRASANNSKDDSMNNINNRKMSAATKTIITGMNRDRLNSIGGRRDRLESWGAMSDLSAAGIHDQQSETAGSGGTATAAALAATIYTSLANDVSAAAGADGNDSISSFLVNDELIPSRISVHRGRFNSIASMATDPSALFHITAGGSNGSLSAGAMAFVEDHLVDQLADLATSMEAITGRGNDLDDSEVSSAASPLIGAATDIGISRIGRPRSSSTSSLININVNINVDYDAVAAAVDAAEAAAGAVDLTNLTSQADAGTVKAGSSSNGNKKKRALSTPGGKHKQQSQNQYSSVPYSDERDMEEIRARARAAAGYVPPDGTNASTLPPKKRAKHYGTTDIAMTPAAVKSFNEPSSNFKTPVISNTGTSKYSDSAAYSDTPASSAAKAPSQKWEAMFDCLLQFVEEQKKEETRGMTEAQKKEWEWDGNVPTTYKTKDGKALGRWVNNQRSAKSKGTLKDDRETRLVDAGLKWSVLASSSWNDMLEELRAYVADQEKQGKKWNGNGETAFLLVKLTTFSSPLSTLSSFYLFCSANKL